MASIAVIAIIALGVFRALQLRRAFTTSTYRTRATWLALLLVLIAISMSSGYFPPSSSLALSLVESSPFFVVIIVVYLLVDRSVMVAMDTDFFHRNTLHWLQVRWPVGVVLTVVMSFIVPGFALLPPYDGILPPPGYPLWGTVTFILFLFVLPLILSFSTAALILAARRTSDRTLRRSILLAGLALSTLVISILGTLPFNTGTLPYVVINQGANLAGMYLLYRSVMSLSPLGRIEKEVAPIAKTIPSGLVTASNP